MIAEEEIASRTSTGSDCSSKGKQVVAEGSSHPSSGEENEEKLARVPVIKNPQPPSIEPVEIPSEYWKIFMAPTTSTINFLIGDLGDGMPTKPIPLEALPNFHGLVSEDLDTFLFEFDIV